MSYQPGDGAARSSGQGGPRPLTAVATSGTSAVVAAKRRTSRGDTWLAAGLGLLLVLVTGSMAGLWRYKSSPGSASDAPPRWPDESRIEREPGLPTLAMFAHPRCPCTRASLSELRVLMSQFDGRVRAYVLFALPEGVGEEWRDGDSWNAAASIPGVRVMADPGRRESRLFGARTSGQVVAYDAAGELTFSGGITGARGHEGDNAGRRSLTSQLGSCDACPGEGKQSLVFGCPLEDPEP